jgi:hypothetical protein
VTVPENREATTELDAALMFNAEVFFGGGCPLKYLQNFKNWN